jgi:hypothetical protein
VTTRRAAHAGRHRNVAPRARHDVEQLIEINDRMMTLKRDDFSWSRHHASADFLRMMFSENRHPLFGVVL